MMKLKYILCSLGLCLYATVAAQAQTTCKILYDYDAAGNRIKRSYGCSSINDPIVKPVTGVVLRDLYPNPTHGPLRGEFSQPVGGNSGAAFVNLSTITGVSLFQLSITEPTTFFDLDISQQLPGTYMLSVAAFGTMESYTVIKL